MMYAHVLRIIDLFFAKAELKSIITHSHDLHNCKYINHVYQNKRFACVRSVAVYFVNVFYTIFI